MKKFIGTKVIMAEPMTMKEAQKVLGRKIATLKPVTVEEDGYLVVYKNGYKPLKLGSFNHPQEMRAFLQS